MSSLPQHKFIYQIFVGRWEGNDVQKCRGRVLENFRRFEWEVLAEMGVTHVYLLGVFDNRGPIVVGEEGGMDIREKDDRLPSPFAIRNHMQVNPDLGTKQEMMYLIRRIQGTGLKVLVDLVPNQTGLEHEWIESHSDYYVDGGGEAARGFSGDVAMLKTDKAEVIAEYQKIMKELVSWGVDGVRCDMAHLTADRFWVELIEHTRTIRDDVEFIAEAYAQSVYNWDPLDRLFECGFDAVYHEFLYRNLKQFFRDELPLDAVAEHINYVNSRDQAGTLVHYAANHDDAFLADKQYCEAMGWLIRLLDGWALVFNGNERGLNHRLAHHYLELLETKFQPTGKAKIYGEMDRYLKDFEPHVIRAEAMGKVLVLRLRTREGEQLAVLNLGQKGKNLDKFKGEVVYGTKIDRQQLMPGGVLIVRQA